MQTSIQPICYSIKRQINLKTKNNKRYNNAISCNISFAGGLSSSFAKYVNELDISSIENSLCKKNITTNFHSSKLVAACAEKTVQIFEDYKLALPDKIEFAPISSKNTLATHQLGSIKINSNIQEFYDINKLSELEECQGNFHPTNHFLATFIHEFAHNAHFKNVSEKIGNTKETIYIWEEMHKKQIRPFWTEIQGNGKYSTTNLLEYMAELITRKIAGNLDSDLKYIKEPKLDIFQDYTTKLELPPAYSGIPSWYYDNSNYISNKNIKDLTKATNKAIWDGDIEFIRHNATGVKNQITSTEIMSIMKTLSDIRKKIQ